MALPYLFRNYQIFKSSSAVYVSVAVITPDKIVM